VRASPSTPSAREGPPRCPRPAREGGTSRALKGFCSATRCSGAPRGCSIGIPETYVRPQRRGLQGNILHPPKGRGRTMPRWKAPGRHGGPSPRRGTGSPPPRLPRGVPHAGTRSPRRPASCLPSSGLAAGTTRTMRRGDPEGRRRPPADRGKGIAGQRTMRTSRRRCLRACRRTGVPPRADRAEGKGGF
jgi:hypothetical protein